MNAIERIARCLSNPVIPNQYDADARDALADLDALYQAAKDVDALVSNDGPPFLLDGQRITGPSEVALLVLHDCLNDMAAAAVRRVEGKA